MQSLDSFCFSIQSDRRSRKAPKPHARGRPSSAAVPAATRPRSQQLWQGLTRSQQSASPKQPEQTEDSSRDASANCSPDRLRAPENSVDSETDAQEVAAADHGKPTTASSAAVGDAPGQSQLQRAAPGLLPDGPELGLIAETAEATGMRGRPGTAQAQIQSPGVFLRKARPQSAGAANVTNAKKTKAAHLGVQTFNEPKRETGWVDFRAQNRMGARVSCLSDSSPGQ